MSNTHFVDRTSWLERFRVGNHKRLSAVLSYWHNWAFQDVKGYPKASSSTEWAQTEHRLQEDSLYSTVCIPHWVPFKKTLGLSWGDNFQGYTGAFVQNSEFSRQVTRCKLHRHSTFRLWVLGIFSRANSIWTDYRHSERGKTQRLPLTLVDSNNCQQIGHCYCLTLNNNSGKKSRKHNAEWQTKLLYIPWVDHWTVHDLTQMMLHWNKDEPHSSLRLEWCWWMRTFLPPDEGQSPSIGRCVWSWHYGMWERRESKTRSWGRALASPCLRRGQEWWFSPVVCSSSTKNE